jgi:hypothetical protein
MYTTVQKALDNLDEHLAKVIESVSSYNPSRATVAALVQADDELQATLAECIAFPLFFQQLKSNNV